MGHTLVRNQVCVAFFRHAMKCWGDGGPYQEAPHGAPLLQEDLRPSWHFWPLRLCPRLWSRVIWPYHA